MQNSLAVTASTHSFSHGICTHYFDFKYLIDYSRERSDLVTRYSESAEPFLKSCVQELHAELHAATQIFTDLPEGQVKRGTVAAAGESSSLCTLLHRGGPSTEDSAVRNSQSRRLKSNNLIKN